MKAGREKRWGWRAALALLAALAVACATTSLPPFSAVGKAVPLEEDEKRLWKKVEQEQVKLDASDRLHADPLLEAYLNEIGRAVAPPPVREGRTPLRLSYKIVNDPAINAFAYPNGRVYVHSGLIARAENEAQLAMVLAHESAHATHRHTIRSIRQQQNTQLALGAASILVQVGLAMLGQKIDRDGNPYLGELVRSGGNVLGQLGLMFAYHASRNGYGRDMEREADAVGFGRYTGADYAPREAPKMFRLLIKEYGDRKSDVEQFFFSSHPRNQERIANISEFIRKLPPGRLRPPSGKSLKINSETFRFRTRPLVRENAYLDIEAGRFNLAAAQLDRVIGLVPNDAKAHHYYGELHRRSATDRSGWLRAVAAYERAVSHDPDLPDPHRGMGLAAYKMGNKGKALEAFRRYLRLAKGKAEDREQVNEYIVELGGAPVR